MNILFVTGIFPPDHGGPASYVPRMAAALAERGNTVEVICLSDRLDHDDSARPFKVTRLPRRTFWPLRIAKTVFTVWRAARRNALVFVHGLASESAVGSAFAGRATVHKVVGDYAWERAVGRGAYRATIDEYQTAPKNLTLQFFDFIRTFPLRWARHIIVPSQYLKRIVSGWDLPPEKISVIYNAAAPTPETNAELAPLPDWRGRTLLTVCRLVPWKCVDAIIRRLPHLPDTRLVIAGGGIMQKDLADLAATLGVADRTVFLGHIPSAEVRQRMRGVDAFVLNSTYEGLPHVVLEAMSVGIPVIATNAGGTGEVVENEVTGLLIPVGDEAALQAAIERLWSDPDLIKRLTTTAAERLAAHFDFTAMVDATAATLRAAIAPTPCLSTTEMEAAR